MIPGSHRPESTTAVQSFDSTSSDVWTHVAFAGTPGGSFTFYINGVPGGTGGMPNNFLGQNTNPLYIGGRADFAVHFQGLIDEIAIWNRALTAAEIAQVAAGPVLTAPIVGLTPREFSSAVTQGGLVGTLSASDAGTPGDIYTYALVAGNGDTDNGKFQVSGDQLQAGTYNFLPDPGGTTYSVRIRATGAPSGETGESAFVLTVRGDSDIDGLLDEYELLWAASLSVLSGLGGADADTDGLTDLQEFNLAGQFPNLNPTIADTDGDSLLDGEEIAGAGARPPTDPTNDDTDGDGLDDNVENNTGTFVDAAATGTNPTLVDTDGDLKADGAEVSAGTNPTNGIDPPPVPLAGYWPFAADSNPQPDLSGNANDATVPGTGAVWALDGERASGVMQFSGGPGLLAPHSASLTINGAITVAAWVKLTANPNFNTIIAKNPSNGSGNNQAGNYELRVRNNRQLDFNWERGTPDSTTGLTSSGTVANNNVWTHVAFAGTPGGSYTFYINGVPAGTGSMPNNFLGQNTNPLYIGNRADAAVPFPGSLDDVALFAGALGPLEIGEIMGGDFSRYVLPSQTPFQITLVVRNPATGAVTLTFPSTNAATYRVDATTDQTAWTELEDNLDGQAGETSYTDTTFAPAPALPGKNRVFYRVTKNP